VVALVSPPLQRGAANPAAPRCWWAGLLGWCCSGRSCRPSVTRCPALGPSPLSGSANASLAELAVPQPEMVTILARFRPDATRSEIVGAIAWIEARVDETSCSCVKVRPLGTEPSDDILRRFTHEITVIGLACDSPEAAMKEMTVAHQLVGSLRPLLENYLVVKSE
jgi:hypothetical protein